MKNTVRSRLMIAIGLPLAVILGLIIIAYVGWEDEAVGFVSIGALALLISSGVGIWVFQSIIGPLAHLKDAIQTIERNSDLSHEAEIESDDEIGEIAQIFNSLLTSFRGVIQEVARSSEELSRSADGLSGVTQASEIDAAQQYSEADLVATASSEMSATVHDVAQNAALAADSAIAANESAGRGQEIVQSAVESIQALADEVNRAGDVINRLEENSNAIGSVLDVIKGIAEQTNLLALNAAIEAARAGEQGRGFAVVADEVRSLAQRTAQSTQEIHQMIQSLQDGSNEAVRAMKIAHDKTQISVEQATEAGTALDSIGNAIGTITNMNTQIATATEEQGAVSEEIQKNIDNIRRLTEQARERGQQTNQAGQDLARLANQFNALVGHFRV
jgi:methyl-accepting chemotaxis protein